MTRVLYWSDLHLGHPFVAGQRSFKTTADHDRHVLEAWASTVTKRDTVFVLGDLCMSSPNRALELLAALPGRKHLILGNHDRAHPLYPGGYKHQRRYRGVFESVSTMAARKIAGHDVMLSHFPYDGDSQGDDRHTAWRLRDEGRWLIHGHVHNEYLRSGRQINVSVDRWMDGPVEEDVLAAVINAAETGAGASAHINTMSSPLPADPFAWLLNDIDTAADLDTLVPSDPALLGRVLDAPEEYDGGQNPAASP